MRSLIPAATWERHCHRGCWRELPFITSEWHGACYDLQSGAALEGPARGDISAYKIHVNGGDREIDL